MPSVLIIEDETELARVLRSYLENAGYRVLTANRGDTGLKTWEIESPDLVLLDLNLPGMDGLDVAGEIRKVGDTPIIMMTARVGEADRLTGLELGADDYIIKPYSPREVVARVKAVLRRSSSSAEVQKTIKAADLEIDPVSHIVTRGGEELELTPTEFNLLETLAGQPGRTFTRLQLLESSQGTAYEGYERSIDAHIKNLRSKVEPDPRQPRYVETVFGVGYRFKK